MPRLQVTQAETVEKMVDSLMEEAKHCKVSLKGLTAKNMNIFLDDIFQDGGEVRCEKFGDLAMEYALQFGELESPEFRNKQWRCIELAIQKIERLHK